MRLRGVLARLRENVRCSLGKHVGGMARGLGEHVVGGLGKHVSDRLANRVD